jgi:hypothetical protein
MSPSKLFIYVWVSVGLAACGGGGDSSSAEPVSSTETFQIRRAYIELLKPSQHTFSVSGTGTENGNVVALSGNGIITYSDLVDGTFGSNVALVQTSTITGNVTGNGLTLPLAETIHTYYDSNNVPLGISRASSYYERDVNSVALPPLTAKVGDSGALWTLNAYSNSTKSFAAGKTVFSYVIEPDTANTALLKIITNVFNTSSTNIGNGVVVFRITPTGGITRLYETSLTTTAEGVDIFLKITY